MLSRMSLYISWVKTWKTLPVMSWVKANNCYKEKRYDLARHYYKIGLDRHPTHVASYAARLDLAYCYFKLRKFDEAQEQLRTLINAMPNFREAHVRLARIQSWMGHSLDAAWTLRRAIQQFKPDKELVSLFLYNITEHESTSYLIHEAVKYAEELREEKTPNLFLDTAFAKLDLHRGNKEAAKEKLLQICAQVQRPFEALMLLAEVFLIDNEVEKSRSELKHLMKKVSDHPRVLSLLAETYLKSGDSYNAEYANQLATSACQNSQWSSPRELHILAESFYHQGDKISALVLASKAKQTGSQLLGSYREIKSLDKLIETLSSSTLA